MSEKLLMPQVQMVSGCQCASALLSVCVSAFCCMQLQLPCLFDCSSVDVSFMDVSVVFRAHYRVLS